MCINVQESAAQGCIKLNRGIKSKGLVVGKTVKNRKCHKIKMGRRKIKSKMFKLKKKTRGVRICKIIKNIQNF